MGMEITATACCPSGGQGRLVLPVTLCLWVAMLMGRLQPIRQTLLSKRIHNMQQYWTQLVVSAFMSGQ
jgi:hypothetical protein